MTTDRDLPAADQVASEFRIGRTYYLRGGRAVELLAHAAFTPRKDNGSKEVGGIISTLRGAQIFEKCLNMRFFPSIRALVWRNHQLIPLQDSRQAETIKTYLKAITRHLVSSAKGLQERDLLARRLKF